MRVADVDLLMVPGLPAVDPDHWITRWSSRLRTARIVHQIAGDRFDRTKWTDRLVHSVEAATRPVVLVAHSSGVPMVVHAGAWFAPGSVVAAFLVAAPSEAACAALPNMDPALTPYPMAPLPFPATLVASRTDPHCPYEVAETMAAAWGASLIDAGDAGHLNTESGHGPWPDGVMRLGLFLQRFDVPTRH
jgi:uncharacterized protein